jgi:hypothetical protein
MLGSLAFTFSSFNLLHFVHPNEVAAVAHIPWLLTLIDIVLVDAKRWRVALAQAFLALLTGSQLLLGCPQFVWFSLLAEACFAAFLVLSRRYLARNGCETMPTCRTCIGCRHSSLSCVIIAKAIGLLVGAVQLLPTLDAALHSTAKGVDLPDLGTLHPINLVQLIAPYMPIDRAFGGSAHELSVYVGAVPLMLALWVFARRRELGDLRRFAQATSAFALLAIALAMGGRLLPAPRSAFWSACFHFSCRYTVLFQLAVAVLAAIGFVLVERQARERGRIQRLVSLIESKHSALALWRRYEVLGGTVLVSLAVAVAGLILQFGHHVASPSRVLVGPLLMATAALLVVAASQGVRGALVGLVLFTAADLGYYGLSCTLDDSTVRPDAFIAQTIAPPVENGNCDAEANRVFAPPAYSDDAAPIGNQMILTGWERIDGCAAMKPRKSLDYFQLAALRAASTRWVHRGPSTATIEGLLPYDEDWSQVPEPMPPARLVTRVVQSDNPATDLPHVDLAREALCEYSLALPPGKQGSAAITQSGGGQIVVEVGSATPQLLVLAESYHPGWRCFIDGAPAPAYRVNGDFLGCVVEPGNTEVRWEFRPDSLLRGRLMTLVGLGLIGLCLFTGAARRELAIPMIGFSHPAR